MNMNMHTPTHRYVHTPPHTNKYINACMHVCKYRMFDKYICTQKIYIYVNYKHIYKYTYNLIDVTWFDIHNSMIMSIDVSDSEDYTTKNNEIN